MTEGVGKESGLKIHPSLGELAQALPVAAIAGGLLTLSYWSGYFSLFKVQWQHYLSLTDMVTGIWALVPPLTVGFILGNLFRETDPKPVTTWLAERAQWANGSPPWKYVLEKLFVSLFAAGPVPFLYFTSPTEFMRLEVALALIALNALAFLRLPKFYADRKNIMTILLLSLSLSALALARLVGLMAGAAIDTGTPNDRVTFVNERSVCTSVLHRTGQGLLLFDQSSRTVTFISNERVAAITLKAQCAS